MHKHKEKGSFGRPQYKTRTKVVLAVCPPQAGLRPEEAVDDDGAPDASTPVELGLDVGPRTTLRAHLVRGRSDVSTTFGPLPSPDSLTPVRSPSPTTPDPFPPPVPGVRAEEVRTVWTQTAPTHIFTEY